MGLKVSTQHTATTKPGVCHHFRGRGINSLVARMPASGPGQREERSRESINKTCLLLSFFSSNPSPFISLRVVLHLAFENEADGKWKKEKGWIKGRIDLTYSSRPPHHLEQTIKMSNVSLHMVQQLDWRKEKQETWRLRSVQWLYRCSPSVTPGRSNFRAVTGSSSLCSLRVEDFIGLQCFDSGWPSAHFDSLARWLSQRQNVSTDCDDHKRGSVTFLSLLRQWRSILLGKIQRSQHCKTMKMHYCYLPSKHSHFPPSLDSKIINVSFSNCLNGPKMI